MEPLNPLERVIQNDLDYLDKPKLDSLFQLTDDQFRPSTNCQTITFFRESVFANEFEYNGY
jgi:hypothetical protein